MPENESSIKVAVVVPKYGLVGGAEGFVYELTESIASRHTDIQMHVISNRWRRGKAPVIFHRARTFSFPRWLRPISFARSVKKIVDSNRFDLVHSHERLSLIHI